MPDFTAAGMTLPGQYEIPVLGVPSYDLLKYALAR